MIVLALTFNITLSAGQLSIGAWADPRPLEGSSTSEPLGNDVRHGPGFIVGYHVCMYFFPRFHVHMLTSELGTVLKLLRSKYSSQAAWD